MGPDIPTDLPVQHLGLISSALGSASGVPPLGEAIAPISGLPGDGAAVVTQVGGWSGGPGAVRWHGGQWVMPYTLAPRSVLQNVSCDVWNPTTTAPANVLVEAVSSNGQVLGSATAPASTSVTFRLWPFVGTHAVIDGEQLVVRLSAKDATTDAWTSAAQDATVIGCAVRATAGIPTTVQYPIDLGSVTTWQDGQTLGGAGAKLIVATGDLITGVRARIQDTGTTKLALAIQRVIEGTASTIATSAQSLGNGTRQTLSIAGLSESVVSGQNYQVVIQRPVGFDNCMSWWIEVDRTPQ